MHHLLDVHSLTVRFNTPRGEVLAVDSVDLQVRRGECMAIVGESGSGKSQLVLSCLGLLPANAHVSGSANFQGTELIGLAERDLQKIRGARIAMIFQDPMSSLTPHMRIGEQLAEVLTAHLGMARSTALERAEEGLRSVKITDATRRLQQYPHELSGGMRQRVMIAMALLTDPDLIIADEPTTALDVTVQAQVLELLREVTQQRTRSVVLITHDLGVVAGLADRVVVMRAGRIVEQSDVHALFASPQHPYTRDLLAAVPRLDAATNA